MFPWWQQWLVFLEPSMRTDHCALSWPAGSSQAAHQHFKASKRWQWRWSFVSSLGSGGFPGSSSMSWHGRGQIDRAPGMIPYLTLTNSSRKGWGATGLPKTFPCFQTGPFYASPSPVPFCCNLFSFNNYHALFLSLYTSSIWTFLWWSNFLSHP